MKTQISAGTIARTIILIFGIVNRILAATGHAIISIDDDIITEVVSDVWVITAAVWAWWKNNSFTSAALKADAVKDALKNGEDVQVYIDDEGD